MDLVEIILTSKRLWIHTENLKQQLVLPFLLILKLKIENTLSYLLTFLIY